jgi:hypothetical protein
MYVVLYITIRGRNQFNLNRPSINEFIFKNYVLYGLPVSDDLRSKEQAVNPF